MYKLGFKEERNQRSNCQHSLGHGKSKGIPGKNTYFGFIDYTKSFDWITTNWKTSKEGSTRPVSWETCVPVKKKLLEPDMEQQIGSNLKKEYIKAVYCHPLV